MYAQGIDERPVEAQRERQQISKETTFDEDLNLAQCDPHWKKLIEQVWNSLNKKQRCARGVSVKLKLKNFQVMQHSKSFKNAIQNQDELQKIVQLLLKEMNISPQMQFRLIGVGVYQLLQQDELPQLSLL